MAQALNVNELAEQLDTTPRIARKFLRSVTPVEEQPGKGGRWSIPKSKARSLKKAFTEFQHEHMRPVTDDHDVDEVIENADV